MEGEAFKSSVKNTRFEMNEQTKVRLARAQRLREQLYFGAKNDVSCEKLFWRITHRTQATNQLLWVMEDKIAEEAVVLDEIDVLLQVTL